MEFNITEFVEALLKLMLVAVTTFLIPWLNAKRENAQFEKAFRWTKKAVEAAEMLFDGFDMGEQKKAYVQEFLAKKGFRYDSDEIDKMIEAAVMEMNNCIWG